MNTTDQQLRDFASSFTPFIERVGSRTLASLEAQPKQRSVWKPLGIGVAAALSLALVLLLGNPSVYAEAIKALEKAHSLHVVGSHLSDGEWVESMNMWYVRDRGVRMEQLDNNGVKSSVLDDGESHWQYASDQPQALRGKHRDDAMRYVRELLSLEAFRKLLKEDPTGTREVEGKVCQVYSETRNSGTWRVDVLLHQHSKRILAWEKFRREKPSDPWEKYQVATASYDLDIPADQFTLSLDPSVKIIDGRTVEKQFESRFALENAIYETKRLGNVIAIHDLKRLDDSKMLVMSSCRASEETIARLGKPKSPYAYGRHQLGSNWKRLEGGAERSYHCTEIASLIHDGIEINCYLIRERGDWPKPLKTYSLGFHLHTDGKLKEELQKQGDDTWWARFRDVAEIPLPDEITPLSEALADLHAETLIYESAKILPALRYDTELSENTEQGRPLYKVIQSPPSKISATEFERRLRKLLAEQWK